MLVVYYEEGPSTCYSYSICDIRNLFYSKMLFA